MVINKTELFLSKWKESMLKRGQSVPERQARLSFLSQELRPKLREMISNAR